MATIRVCHLSKFYPPAPGGIETSVRTLALAQADLGLDVSILCMDHGSAAETVREADGPVAVTRFARKASGAKLDYCPGLASALRQVEADVLHLHVPNPTMILALLRAGVRRPMVVTYHSDVIRQRLRAALFRPLERLVYRRASVIMPTSPPYVEGSPFLKSYADRVRVVPLGIDLAPYLEPSESDRREAEALRKAHPGPLWVGCGRLVYYKGFPTALRALTRVPGTLLLVGEGPDREALEAEAARLGVGDRVSFTGKVPALVPYYLAADAFWFPSNARSEAFGLVQVEAMASGCPVINTAIPGSGVAWVSRHEREGLTIPVGDPAALAEAANRLLTEPGLRDRLASAGRERAVREFDHRVMARRTAEIYREVLAAGREAGPSPRPPHRDADDEADSDAGSSGAPEPAALRALHVSAGNLFGGLEVLLRTMARHRRATPDLEHRFACCFDGRIARDLREAGVPVAILGPVRFSRPWMVLRARRALRRLLAEDRPDVLVCHSPWAHALFAAEGRRAGIPVAYWQHDVSGTGHWLVRLAMRQPADLVIVGSRATAASARLLFPKAEPRILACPSDPPESPDDPEAARAEVRRALGADDDRVVIFQASRMVPLKGIHVLIEALGRLADRPGWALWLAAGAATPAEHDYRARLEARAAALGLADRVQFLGFRSDVPALMAAADLYAQANVLPEAFGLTFVEALYAGRPVVTSALGAAPEIVDESTGRLVPPGDVAALASALRELIDDPAQRRRLGAAGPARAASLCDPARQMRRLRDLLAGLAGRASAPSRPLAAAGHPGSE